MTVRVVLAEDSLLVREGIAQIVRSDPGFEVVALCDDLPSLLETVETVRPDVVVTDIRMPPSRSDEGIRAASTLRDSHPSIGVLVLSQYAEPGFVLALLEDGTDGRGYLLKERIDDPAELRSAVETVAARGSVIDSKVVELLVRTRTRASGSPLDDLTPRERDVLAEIAQGKSNAAIAASLGLAKRSVEKNINAIFLKLGLADADSVSKRVKAALVFLADESDPPFH